MQGTGPKGRILHTDVQGFVKGALARGPAAVAAKGGAGTRPFNLPAWPDVDFAKASAAFGVEAETVKEASQLKGAIARAQKAVADGRPYLLDIDTYRDGIGAASTWHPTFSLADARKRRV